MGLFNKDNNNFMSARNVKIFSKENIMIARMVITYLKNDDLM
jgi:hypothetical protein